ncbi:hypothetical protein POSPLADRAFT_1141091 [Postia placenta MAD-698-R-SB12]|uniref:Polyketide synthase n=2 Tax=Postia placenta MAD-698-R-SB12 TaxID=670580 RepID=A0A1X6N1X8_9APHY|nr:hypothetical protein POSPLADRAFT_1141091 [Postia placenta MAD-698-R-SB12]OSX62618.1 hypothetical protein POSPLADRAFT_1141091 [Postia placenta MAD-698-R-SB12]
MPTPIAIVGISAELPSGTYSKANLEHSSFFDFLLNGEESYECMPDGRFNVEAWKGNNRGEIRVNAGSFLKDIDLFDNVEFGISARDARTMAPATRKLVEQCFLALVDSGIDYRNRNVGCFTSGTNLELTNVADPDEFDCEGSFAGNPSMISNRVSTHLDLLGPSVPTDTACSSSLTALHLAVQSISNGECDAAVVAGCQLNHRFGRAEACVAIVVKPLQQAIQDADQIYATILATAINSSGGGAPPGAPVAEAQRDAMRRAFKLAERNPREVDFIELHATGTAKGDPTEVNWVGEEFSREDEVLIGSVKGNIGHTEIAAFLASLSKVISIFRSRQIPPNVNVKELNPAIQWLKYQLRVPRSPTPLPCHSARGPLIAMSSSGIGGSNGHAVLEGPPTRGSLDSRAEIMAAQPSLLVSAGLSSRSTVAFSESITNMATRSACEVPVLSTILGRRSRSMTWRSFAIADSASLGKLQFSSPQLCPREARPVVFVFSGQGPQHERMGRELFERFTVFRHSVLEMDRIYETLTGSSMLRDYGLFDGCGSPGKLKDVWPISLILPSIAMFQIALFDLLTSFGMKPDIIIGHSAGETAMLYASGAAPKEMAFELAVIRGRAFAPLEALGGGMAAISCGKEDAEEIIASVRSELPDNILEIACFNSPSAIAIAGHDIAITRALELCQTRGVFGRKIRTSVPMHSSMMERCREDYCRELRALFERYPGQHVPQIPTYSTLTGERLSDSIDADYFWRNTRSPVRFTQAMERLTASQSCTFVEISPHPVLVSYISSMAGDGSPVISTMHRVKPNMPSVDHVDLLRVCGELTASGFNGVNFTALNNRACYECDVSLPAYPFSKKSYALYPDTPGYAKQMEPHLGPLNHRYLRINKDTHPVLAEHVIRGEPIMPAAGFIEMAIEFGATALLHVDLKAILSLSSETPPAVEVELNSSYWKVQSVTSHDWHSGKQQKRLHADGYLTFEPSQPLKDIDIATIRQRCKNHVGSCTQFWGCMTGSILNGGFCTAFYSSLSYFSAYGPRLRRVTNVYYSEKEALVSIKGMDNALKQPFNGNYDQNAYYLPAHVDAVLLHRNLAEEQLPHHLYAHVVLKEWWPVAKHHIDPLPAVQRPLHLIYQPAFFAPQQPTPASLSCNDPLRIKLDTINCYVSWLACASVLGC